MLQRTIVWLCLADGEHAKILVPADSGRGYAIVSEFDSAEAHQATRALGTDRPPRTQESAYTGRHAIAPRSDLHRASKRRFMQLVAAFLDVAAARDECDALVLVAPAYCLRELRGSLKAATLRKVRATRAKDLLKLPLAKLPSDLLAPAAAR